MQHKACREELFRKFMVEYCLKLLDKESIKYLAKMIANECKKTEESYIINDLKKKLSETETAISNLFKTLEYGTASELVLVRLEERQMDKEKLEKELAIESLKQVGLENEINKLLENTISKKFNDLYKSNNEYTFKT